MDAPNNFFGVMSGRILEILARLDEERAHPNLEAAEALQQRTDALVYEAAGATGVDGPKLHHLINLLMDLDTDARDAVQRAFFLRQRHDAGHRRQPVDLPPIQPSSTQGPPQLTFESLAAGAAQDMAARLGLCPPIEGADDPTAANAAPPTVRVYGYILDFAEGKVATLEHHSVEGWGGMLVGFDRDDILGLPYACRALLHACPPPAG